MPPPPQDGLQFGWRSNGAACGHHCAYAARHVGNTNVYINPHICHCMCVGTYIYVCLYLCMFFVLPCVVLFCMCVCLPVCLPARMPVCMYICMGVCDYAWLCVWCHGLPACLDVCIVLCMHVLLIMRGLWMYGFCMYRCLCFSMYVFSMIALCS